MDQPSEKGSWMQTARRLVRLIVIPAVALAAYLVVHSGQRDSACFAQSDKKCGCPIAPGETVLMQCQSIYPERCGACSVRTASKQREARPCLTLQ